MNLQILAKRFGNVKSFPYLCTRNIKSSHLRMDSPTEPYGRVRQNATISLLVATVVSTMWKNY